MVLGIDDQPPNKEHALALNRESIETNLVRNLLLNLKRLEFETRKDVGLIVGAFLRIKEEENCPMADYFENNADVMMGLVDRYNDCHDPHIGLVAGGILRDCIRHVKLARSKTWLLQPSERKRQDSCGI